MPPASPSRSAENTVVYATGLVQGIILVTFPAASTILTESGGYGLSTTQYGAMFVPQVVAAILASLIGGRLGDRFGIKRVYLAGLIAGLVSMLVLALSQFAESDPSLAYPLLLFATFSLGAGFGLTVPALNTFAAEFHPETIDRSVLVLNALLGLGTALAPVFVAVFVGLGFWWGLPLLSSALVIGLFLFALRLPLRVDAGRARGEPREIGRRAFPRRFWLYAAVAVLYGIIETMSGNWSQLLMRTSLTGSALTVSLALTAFWAMVTIGRIGFAFLQRAIPDRWIYRVIPLLVAGAYVLVLSLSRGSAVLGVLAFGLAGLGCSALLPLTVSFGEEELVSMKSAAAGRLIAFYQIGYGIAAFGVGPLLSGGLALGSVFGGAAIVAVGVSVLAVAITRRRASANADPRRAP